MIRRGRFVLIGGAALVSVLLTAWFLHRENRPEGVPAIVTAGSQPGWRFARSDPPGRLSLIYQFPGSRMQFIGACHQGPVFFYIEEDIAGPATARIDGVREPLSPSGEHGGLFFDEALATIARIAEARHSIELIAGAQRRTLKPGPDIAAFVAECRKLVSGRS